mgnify:FL=1
MNVISLGVITAYVLILFYYIKDTEYTKMLGLTLVTALIICQFKNTNFEGLTNSSDTNTHSGTSADVVDDGKGEMPKTKLIKQKKSKIISFC